MTEHKKQWEKFIESWEKLDQPGRPNKEVTLTFFRYVSKLKEKSNLVTLGCTPELRDRWYVLSEIYGTNVYCVDMSKIIYKAMTQLTVYKNKKERFIHANWIDMPLKDGFADVVTGDFPIANIPKNIRRKFFIEIKRIMNDGAVFITREDTLLRWFPKKIKFEKEFLKQAKHLLRGDKGIRQVTGYLGELMIRSSAKNKNSIAYMGYHLKDLDKLYKQYEKMDDPLSKAMIIIMDNLKETYFATPEKKWVIHPERMFKKELKEHFKIVKIMKLKTTEWNKGMKIYVMMRK